MEDKKTTSKEVKMQPDYAKVESASDNQNHVQKLSYEQLNQAAAELSQQCQNQNIYIQKLRQQLQQMEAMLQSRRLDYLFEVVKLNDTFSHDFLLYCIHEIEEALVIPEEEDKKEQED